MNHLHSFDGARSTLAKGLALYIHIPYCKSRCTYCDFNAHLVPQEELSAFQQYIQALKADIEVQSPSTVSTLFFGGGTPSLTPIPLLREIFDSLNRRFTWAPDLESSIEVNPGTVSEEQFESYLSLGINRLSVGAQSFQQKHLELVGRLHTGLEIESCFSGARRAGFRNLSIDLIYGFPEQTPAHWQETLQRALQLEPDHLSVYQLTVEPMTRLETQLRQGELKLPPEDDTIWMDDLAEKLLSEAGYRRYEISNWAKPGRECRHNFRYWNDSPYLGLGCGAVSYLDGWRFERIKPPAYYQNALKQGRSPVVFAERRGLDGALKDHLMMGLRVSGGVRCSDLETRYPGLCRDQLEAFFQRLPSTWWKETEGGFELTRSGWDFHSQVTMELMDVMFSF